MEYSNVHNSVLKR